MSTAADIEHVGQMTVRDLIDRLSELPAHWRVCGTRSRSLEVWGDGQFGWVFTDSRPTLIHHERKSPYV